MLTIPVDSLIASSTWRHPTLFPQIRERVTVRARTQQGDDEEEEEGERHNASEETARPSALSLQSHTSNATAKYPGSKANSTTNSADDGQPQAVQVLDISSLVQINETQQINGHQPLGYSETCNLRLQINHR